MTYYGVNAVFENAIRAALVSRRQQRFWLAGFKRVQRPLLLVRHRTLFMLLQSLTVDELNFNLSMEIQTIIHLGSVLPAQTVLPGHVRVGQYVQ